MTFLLSVLAYVIVTTIIFGSPFQPFALANGQLGAPYWLLIAILCVAASSLVFILPFTKGMSRRVLVPTFIVLAILLPTIVVGLYADGLRRRAVLAFGADEVEENSFFRSIREAPRDFQFFLHTAAIKGCTTYAWSYRSMAFYSLPPSAAPNVVPHRWVTRCSLRENASSR